MENVILTATIFLATLVSGTLMDFVKRIIKSDKRWVNRLMSWVLSILASYTAWVIGYLPAIGQPEWAWILVEGVGVGLMANGIYTSETIKKIYDFLFSFIDGKWYDKKDRTDKFFFSCKEGAGL